MFGSKISKKKSMFLSFFNLGYPSSFISWQKVHPVFGHGILEIGAKVGSELKSKYAANGEWPQRAYRRQIG